MKKIIITYSCLILLSFILSGSKFIFPKVNPQGKYGVICIKNYTKTVVGYHYRWSNWAEGEWKYFVLGVYSDTERMHSCVYSANGYEDMKFSIKFDEDLSYEHSNEKAYSLGLYHTDIRTCENGKQYHFGLIEEHGDRRIDLYSEK